MNLLLALDALLEENSVQGAAERLHLSAPAVSRALARIRRATGDDILVRTGRTMTPTTHALQLRNETHALVERAKALLTPSPTLDLATLTRVFSIKGHDALTTALGPPLIAAIVAQAPHVALRILGEAPGESSDLVRGHVDLEVGDAAPVLPEIMAETVGSDKLVTVFRAGHQLSQGELTPERFAAATHVTVSRRGRLRDPIDDALAGLGLSRRVVASLSTSAAALVLTARTDVVAVVTEQLGGVIGMNLGLSTAPLPFPTLPVPVIVAWHRRYDTDAAHTWFRGQVLDALRSLLARKDLG